MMLPLVFAILTTIFTLYSLFLKNESYKKFFFLLSMLFVILTFSSFYAKEVQVCSNFDATTNTCLEWQTSISFAGTEPLIYGFGLLFLVFLALMALEIITKSIKMAVG
jgi:hypothetical protein